MSEAHNGRRPDLPYGSHGGITPTEEGEAKYAHLSCRWCDEWGPPSLVNHPGELYWQHVSGNRPGGARVRCDRFTMAGHGGRNPTLYGTLPPVPEAP